jgi:hypothetical protein
MKYDKELWDEWDTSSFSGRDEMIKKHGCKKIALMKWHPDNPNQGLGNCSYCGNIPTDCIGCPLKVDICGFAGSLWDRWSNAYNITEEKELADAMFHAIMKVKEVEK